MNKDKLAVGWFVLGFFSILSGALFDNDVVIIGGFICISTSQILLYMLDDKSD